MPMPRYVASSHTARTCMHASTNSLDAHFFKLLRQGSILGSFLLSCFGWLLVALGHDAGHFAASRKPWVNDLCAFGISLFSNPIVWQHQHTFAHHSYSNDFDHDPDLHHFKKGLRIHRRFQRRNIHKKQSNWLFVVFLYTFVLLGTAFSIPFRMIALGGMYGVVDCSDRNRPIRALLLLFHMLGYAGFIVVLPFYVHPHWLSALAAVELHLATSSLLFALFTQINHISEASFASQSLHSENPVLRGSWAVEQVETANNFCPQSLPWHILSNGLNLQIEHHLFPGLNHCHLPCIQPTVQATCEEFGVRYKCYDSWNDVFAATLAWLEKLADEPYHDDKTD